MNENKVNPEAWERGHEKGWDEGKKFAKNLVLELMDEVIEAYDKMPVSNQEEANHKQVQTNAVRFMKSWVMSGGQEDLDGNRVCLPW